MTIETKFLAYIAERDIDLLLVEELTVNPEFGDWFTSRLYGRAVFKEALGTWHSVTDSVLGESDLLFVFRNEDDGRVAVLIENKIDASAQPQQAARYRERGEKGILAQDWEAFLTCVVAPKEYLSAGDQAFGYDAQVGYEEILSFFVSRRSRDRRFAFKGQVLLEGIEKHRRGYVAVISEPMTSFVRDYRSIALARNPRCGVQEARPRPAGSTWVMFLPVGLAKSRQLIHQLTAGNVKLLLSGFGDRGDQISEQVGARLDADMELAPAGKSLAVTIRVPVLDPLQKTAEAQREAIEMALSAVDRLAALEPTIRL
jgi:hypothetical protein